MHKNSFEIPEGNFLLTGKRQDKDETIQRIMHGLPSKPKISTICHETLKIIGQEKSRGF